MLDDPSLLDHGRAPGAADAPHIGFLRGPRPLIAHTSGTLVDMRGQSG
ncbi:hypothetical protein [Streptomyces sp. NPDC002159]